MKYILDKKNKLDMYLKLRYIKINYKGVGKK